MRRLNSCINSACMYMKLYYILQCVFLFIINMLTWVDWSGQEWAQRLWWCYSSLQIYEGDHVCEFGCGSWCPALCSKPMAYRFGSIAATRPMKTNNLPGTLPLWGICHQWLYCHVPGTFSVWPTGQRKTDYSSGELRELNTMLSFTVTGSSAISSLWGTMPGNING